MGQVIESLVWTDQPLPFRRRSGSRAVLTPLEVTDGHEADPVVALETGHAFVDRGAEFLLTALLQLAMPPEDEEAWASMYRAPPSPKELAAALVQYRHALDLVDPAHPMLQVRPEAPIRAAVRKAAARDDEDAGQDSIAALLPDRPTVNDSRNNRDCFAKRQHGVALSAGVLGALLYAHMVLFPLGGGGYFSLPHGSRSVKFALTGDTLWRSLWLNVLGADNPILKADVERWQRSVGGNQRAAPADDRSFAWLRPELASLPLAKGTRQLVQAHEFSAVGIPMQRRYLLGAPRSARCDLTGQDGPAFTTYERWPGGLDFSNSGWAPLCVAEGKLSKPGNRSFVSIRSRPLRLDDLLDLPIAIGPAPPENVPRLAVLSALRARAYEIGDAPNDVSAVSNRLRVSLRATALGGENVAEFLSERTLPLYRLPGDAGPRMLTGIHETGEALRNVIKALLGVAKAVLQPADRDRQQDRKFAAYLGDALALRMEQPLFNMIEELARTDAPEGHGPTMQRSFVEELRRECLAVFDAAFPLPEADSEAAHVATQRRRLLHTLRKLFDDRGRAVTATRA